MPNDDLIYNKNFNVKVICPLLHFEIEDTLQNLFFQANYLHPKGAIPAMTSDELFFCGDIVMDQIRNNPVLLYQGTDTPLKAKLESYNYQNLVTNINTFYSNFALALGFVKDHSVFVSTSLLYVTGTPYAFSDRRINSMTNSKGEYENTLFGVNEIRFALNIKKILIQIPGIPQNKYLPREEDLNTKMHIPDFQKDGVPQNRVLRALVFLQMALTSSYVPVRICFYIIVFESLLSGYRNPNAADLVKLRTSVLLGNNAANTAILDTAYEITNKFFHGQTPLKTEPHGLIPLTYSEFVQVSQNIDTLLRSLFNKVLSERFNEFATFDDDAMTKWYRTI